MTRANMNEKRSVGRISVHPRGFGFFEVEGTEEPSSAFVAPPDLNPFLEGDRVEARLEIEADGRARARGLKLIARMRRKVFGEVVFHKGEPYLRVDKAIANRDWPLEIGDSSQAAPSVGDLLVAELEGDLLRPLRSVRPEEAGLERVLVRHRIVTEFTDAALTQAREGAIDERPRQDLSSLPTVTIDAPSSRDLDDALAVLPADGEGALRVFVSIADVDALVPEGSPIDLEARERGTSVYLAGRVVPMLPPALSEDSLSLLPGELRPALTVELRIDPEGRITSTDIYPSTIRSTMRLSYEVVAAFLDEGLSDDLPDELRSTLRWLRTAAARLSVVRAARGGLEISREDVKIVMDEAGENPTGLQQIHSTSAHRLVERLMVAANEAVAGWLVARGLPAVFRVHPAPEPEQLERLGVFIGNLGFEAGFGGALSPLGLAALEAQFRDTSVAPAFYSVLLGALGPARYTTVSGPHFGLASSGYLHFTSPIRRYADLMVHRVVKRYLSGERDAATSKPLMEPVCLALNEAGRRASKAELERLRMLAARFLSTKIGWRGKGHVVAVKAFGLIVQLSEFGVGGTVAQERLPDGPYRFDPVRRSLVGRDQCFTVGQQLEVEIESTDEELGRVELGLLSE
jgi:ribonuclease R